jgi:hypothetical protein
MQEAGLSMAWGDPKRALPATGRGLHILLKSRYSRRLSMFSGRKLPITLAFVVLVALAIGASCKGFFVDPTLTAISVGPNDQNIQQGDTLQMSARGTYDDGSVKNITSSVLWASDASDVASIDKKGLVTGVLAPGTANISASLDTLSNSVAVNVVLTGVTKITIQPVNPSVKQGTTQDFTCTASLSGKPDVDITASVNWSTSDTTHTHITNNVNPMVFSVDGGTASEAVIVTATYVVGTVTFTDTTTVQVTQ